jgi:3-methyladenine DNA glycosylase AlkD
LHKHGTDKQFLRGLDLIEAHARDARNFVKKAVSWALRAIGGKKSPTLRMAAREVAERLATSEDPAERWVGKDALREFSRKDARAS